MTAEGTVGAPTCFSQTCKKSFSVRRHTMYSDFQSHFQKKVGEEEVKRANHALTPRQEDGERIVILTFRSQTKSRSGKKHCVRITSRPAVCLPGPAAPCAWLQIDLDRQAA
jgi:hypothetical protein